MYNQFSEEINACLRALPVMPAATARILEELSNPAADMSRIEGVLADDPVLVARVLRIANSSFYGMSRKISCIREALVILGVNTLRNLVATSAVVSQTRQLETGSFDLEQFWIHSSGVAISARLMARQLRMNSDVAFISGLLHDIGRLIIVALKGERLKEIEEYAKRHGCELVVAEREVIETDHAIIGGCMAKFWNLPEEIELCIRDHHEPDRFPDMQMARLIHVADEIIHLLDDSSGSADGMVGLVAPLQLSWDMAMAGDMQRDIVDGRAQAAALLD